MPARACRGCLATDVKLFNIYKNNLYEAFGDVVGNPIFECDDLPQHICAICYAQLKKYITFRNRVRVSQDLLEEVEQKGIKLTTPFIKTIDRQGCKLIHKLEIFNPLPFDFVFEESEEAVPTEAPPDDTALNKEQDIPEPWSPWSTDAMNDDPEPEISEQNPPEQNTADTKPTKPHKQSRSTNEKYMETFKNNFNVDIFFLTKEQQIEESREKVKEAVAMLAKSSIAYCLECGKRCFNAQALEKHRQQCHDESIGVQCEVCTCRYPEDQMRLHTESHSLRLKCKECGQISKGFSSARSHASTHMDSKKTIPCKYCEENFDSRADLNTHYLEKHQDKMLFCKYCGEVSMHEIGIAHHVNKVHADILSADFQCSGCEQMFANKEALETHTSLSCEGFNCLVCGKQFESKQVLREHINAQHSRGKFIRLELCSGCGVKLFGAEALEKHQGGDYCGNGMPCLECGATFADVASMSIHKADFHKIVIRACDSCDKAFEPKEYRWHMLRVHNIKVEAFRSVFPRPSTRVWMLHGGVISSMDVASRPREEQLREIDKPLICHMCGKAFSRHKYLQDHMRSHHNKEDHFKCDQCNRSFPKKEKYEAHMLVHTGEKPYSCQFCERKFRLKVQLRNHIKTHLNMRSHICHVCGKKFRTSTCVKTHIRAVHLKMPTRGPKKWEMDRLRRLDEGIEEEPQGHVGQGQVDEGQGQADEIQTQVNVIQEYLGENERNMSESEDHNLEIQGQESVTEDNVMEIEDHVVEIESHVVETQDHMDSETNIENNEVKEYPPGYLPPEGLVHETGYRIYPVREKKKKIHTDHEPKVKGVRKKRQPRKIKKKPPAEPSVRNVTYRLHIEPGKVQFRPVTEREEEEEESDDKEEEIDEETENVEDTEELPRVIKTIHINKNRTNQPNQIQKNAQNTQFITDTLTSVNINKHRQSNQHQMQDHTQHTQIMDTHNTDYPNTHSLDYSKTHTQYIDNNKHNIVYNTLSSDLITAPKDIKNKKVKKVRKIKGKSMPSLDLDAGSSRTDYTKNTVNMSGDNRDSVNINEYLGGKKLAKTVSISTGITQSYLNSGASHSRQVVSSKDIILERKGIHSDKPKYVLLASTKNKTIGSISKSGKTGWKLL